MTIEDIEDAVLETMSDPAERREVLRAVRDYGDGCLDGDGRDTLLEHGHELFESGSFPMVLMLAEIGFEPALVILMLGGGTNERRRARRGS